MNMSGDRTKRTAFLTGTVSAPSELQGSGGGSFLMSRKKKELEIFKGGIRRIIVGKTKISIVKKGNPPALPLIGKVSVGNENFKILLSNKIGENRKNICARAKTVLFCLLKQETQNSESFCSKSCVCK